jgi:hypothetical protein
VPCSPLIIMITLSAAVCVGHGALINLRRRGVEGAAPIHKGAVPAFPCALRRASIWTIRLLSLQRDDDGAGICLSSHILYGMPAPGHN